MTVLPLRSKREHGFTLLEVLVAIAIFGVMAAMAYGGLSAVLETRKALDQTQARLAMIQKTFYRLQADLESAQNRPVRDAFSVALPSLAYGEEQGLEFTRGGLRNPIGLPRSSLERVAYVIKENEETEKAELLRRRWPVLDRADDTPFVETVLLDNIEEVAWRFLGEGEEWQTQWPPLGLATTPGETADAGLPRAVELTLTTEDYGELRYLFRLTPPVQAATQTPSSQTPPPVGPTPPPATPAPRPPPASGSLTPAPGLTA